MDGNEVVKIDHIIYMTLYKTKPILCNIYNNTSLYIYNNKVSID